MTHDSTHDSDEDIRTFLRSGFSDICCSPNHRSTMEHIKKPWPADSVIEDLVDRASSQFIYASTVLKFVGDPSSLPINQLELILSVTRASKNNNSTNPFADLDQLYMEILSTAPDKQRTMDVLGIALAFLDLGLKDHQNFLDVWSLMDLPEPEQALKAIRSLVDVSQDGGISFFDKSFTDFLLDASRSGDYFIDINAAHTNICVTCLRSFRLKYKNALRSSRTKSIDAVERYAVRFWDDHWLLSATSDQTRLLDEIKSLNASSFYYHLTQEWVRARASTVWRMFGERQEDRYPLTQNLGVSDHLPRRKGNCLESIWECHGRNCSSEVKIRFFPARRIVDDLYYKSRVSTY
ncbi:hypothetical protein BDZ97DRAFT_1821076 [Flammula alnicola]|nr:hypothetical protein BDZ97DRAFT_1821076 [Flammula alnicola]